MSQILTLASFTVAALLGAGLLLRQQRQDDTWPQEYRLLREAVQRIAAHNSLGKQPIAFSITAGSYAADLAMQRHLCRQDRCDFFAQLDPFRRYDTSWNELIRQAYSLGDIEAWSASSGTVTISRASFRAYGPRQGWLACTVAHELAHLRRNHVFAHSYYTNTTLKDTQEEQRRDLSTARGRDQELEADRDSAEMMLRSGLPGRACLDNLIFLHHSSGDGSATETDSTHPGYDDRLRAMKQHYERLEQSGRTVGNKRRNKVRNRATGTPGSFRYDRANNLLLFIPQRP